ncbi:MAG: GNAT family N-acetyltransferase [Lachnospiraceae bacterium]|nr:GNAT family N-acetyltransferase [Lachnospiraceae bacterium]
MIQLKEIAKDNLDEVLALSVAEHQKSFVSTVAASLAQAYVYKDTAFPFGIYAGDKPVGFIMLGYYESRKQYTLWKFLIDKEQQGKGYGKEALKQGIAYLKERFDAKEIFTGVSLGNERAKHLYRSFGFVETGLIEDGMEEMRLCI